MFHSRLYWENWGRTIWVEYHLKDWPWRMPGTGYDTNRPAAGALWKWPLTVRPLFFVNFNKVFWVPVRLSELLEAVRLTNWPDLSALASIDWISASGTPVRVVLPCYDRKVHKMFTYLSCKKLLKCKVSGHIDDKIILYYDCSCQREPARNANFRGSP